jgi:hypothetical protein
VKKIEAVVKTYPLRKEFGGASLILIAPAFILANETGQDLIYTYNSNYNNMLVLKDRRFTPLVLKSEKGFDQVHRTIFFNCDVKE